MEEEEGEGSKDDESGDGGDEEEGNGSAEESDSEATESDSSDSDDAPHPWGTAKASTSTSTSTQLYQQRRRQPRSTTEVVAITISEEVPEIVSLPIQPVHHVIVTTPIQTESVTITPTTVETTTIPTTIPTIIPTTTLEPISQPYNFGDFTQGFDFDKIFSFPPRTAEASTSRDPDPRNTRITTLQTQVAGLLETGRKSREESEAQQAQIHSLVDEDVFRAEGERGKEKEKEKPSKPSGDEACHTVDLTEDDDEDKDPEAGPSGSEQQALAIVPISAVPMDEGE
ncbi:hypothetical protein L1987_40372 [Smallanthus sonchifolius]|uniref:Uncharacterized protein n=1 Tax=Smallanthus sonchifolius TaxID=185202 RepID=A0ACB9GT62_9ASTR|nr:hypothetical protein L1987_40372 [Smallanthus sonchifolius]